MSRAILAAVAGFVTNAILVMLSDWVMAMLFPQLYADPSDPTTITAMGLGIGLGFGFLFAIVGGWLAATIGQQRALQAVQILIGLIVVFAIVSAVTFSGRVPLWYSIALPVLGAAGAWLGLQLRQRTASSTTV